MALDPTMIMSVLGEGAERNRETRGDQVNAGFDILAGIQQYKYGRGQARQAKNTQVDNMKNIREAFAQIEAAEQNLSDLERVSSEVVGGYKSLADQGIAEESYLNQEEQIARSAAAGVQYLQGSRAGIRGIGNLARGTTDAYRELNAIDAQARLDNQRAYLDKKLQTQGLISQARDYASALRTGRQAEQVAYQQGLEFAGQQNKIGGITKIGEGASQLAGSSGGMGGTASDMMGGKKSDPYVNPDFNPNWQPPTGIGYEFGQNQTPIGSTPQMQGIGGGNYGNSTFGQSLGGFNRSGYSLI